MVRKSRRTAIFETGDIGWDEEAKDRDTWAERSLEFGVSFLDDAVRGILPNELILLGAPSGLGKTQLCANIAIHNAVKNKRVYYIALEARKNEIQQRLKYQSYAELFFDDPDRPSIEGQLNYKQWLMKKFDSQLSKYDDTVSAKKEILKNILFFYKDAGKFDVGDLIANVVQVQHEVDLIIVDHLHYFDLDDDNENRAMKKILQTVRSLVLENNKPIILVSHLRKKDKKSQEEFAAGLDEFHGSSDIFKIATITVTLGPGKLTQDGKFKSYMRIPKMRDDGSVARFLAETFFNNRMGQYDDEYRIGSTSQGQEFTSLPNASIPYWAISARREDSSNIPGEAERPLARKGVQRPIAARYNPSERD